MPSTFPKSEGECYLQLCKISFGGMRIYAESQSDAFQFREAVENADLLMVGLFQSVVRFIPHVAVKVVTQADPGRQSPVIDFVARFYAG